MKKIGILSVIMFLCVFVLDFSADCTVNDRQYFSDGKNSIYLVEKDNEGHMTVWHYFENSKSKIRENTDFDGAFYSDGSFYLTENKGRILYVMPMDKKSELAEVSLSDEYIMAVEGDYWYFLDKADLSTVIKYNYSYGTSEDINVGRDVEIIFTDTASKGIFGISKDGVIDVNKNSFIECEVPKMPFRYNTGRFTDSDGIVYSFDSGRGFETVLDTGYKNICCIKNNIYALDDKNIYCMNESGDVISVCHPEVDVSDIISSGENLYGITDGDIVYIPKSSFEKYIHKQDIVSEISEKEPSKTESRSEMLVSEPSRVIQRSMVESSVKEYSRVIERSVTEIVKRDYNISIDKFDVYEDMIFIEQGTTVAGLKKGISYGDNKISITNHNGKNVTSGTMGTGWRIDFSGNGEIRSYYTVVTGDVTGEGNINSNDIYLLKDYIFGKKDFTKYQIMSADIKQNGVIDSVDLYMLAKENQLI